MKIFLVLAVFFLFVVNESCLGDTTEGLESVSSIMESASKEGEHMNLPVNKYTDEGMKAARETSAFFYSPEMQKRLESEQHRLTKGVFKAYTQPWQKEQNNLPPKPSSLFSEEEKIYLFLSSSVPAETIHAYLVTIVSVGTPNVIPVMHGLVKGLTDIKASTAFFNRIIQEDLACRDVFDPQQLCRRFQLEIKVNPTLFRKYNITRVPAVVYENTSDSFTIEGDMRLAYMLERINREAKSPNLATFITTIQRTN